MPCVKLSCAIPVVAHSLLLPINTHVFHLVCRTKKFLLKLYLPLPPPPPHGYIGIETGRQTSDNPPSQLEHGFVCKREPANVVVAAAAALSNSVAYVTSLWFDYNVLFHFVLFGTFTPRDTPVVSSACALARSN